LAAQGGANLIYGAGMLDLGITFDFAQFVIDNEIYKMIRKVINGIKIDDEKLAIDLIKEIGPGGELVSHPHTFQNFKAEQSCTGLFDRSMREAWIAEGKKDLAERAYAKAKEIIATHKVPALPDGVEATIRDIIEEAEEEYGMKK
jgi:trimethylamine--corrinoid protein Co-methyltransferase